MLISVVIILVKRLKIRSRTASPEASVTRTEQENCRLNLGFAKSGGKPSILSALQEIAVRTAETTGRIR